MLLIDDPAHTVISPLESEKDDMERLYDTDLMLGGGRAAGYRLTEARWSGTGSSAVRTDHTGGHGEKIR